MSAKRSVIIHQTSAFVILLAEISLYYLAIFIGRGAKFGFPSAQGTLVTLLILTLLVFEKCAIIQSLAN